jgi:signal transduction histidine kinase/CheY-like chemotaxis protein
VIDTERLDSGSSVNVTESYINPLDGSRVVAFYDKIYIREDGEDIPAVFLRVVPVSVFERQWEFSNYYPNADILLINSDGNYIVKPDKVENGNFFDTLAADVELKSTDDVRTEILKAKSGCFSGKTTDGNKVHIAYTHIGVNNDLILIGGIPDSEFNISATDWTIPVIILVAILITGGINVSYLWYYGHQSREMQKIMQEQLSIIDVLSQEFQTLWVVDDNTKQCRMYRGDEESLLMPEDENTSKTATYDMLMNRYIDMFVVEDERESLKRNIFSPCFFDKIPENGSIYSINYTRILNGLTSYFQMCFARALNTSGEKVIILGLRNIDDIVRKEMQQNEMLSTALSQAETANEAKSSFLSNMSHDIRTPLNGIMGMTVIAENHIDDSKRVADCLKKITVASKHLLALINEVLDMSKIESGKIDLVDEVFSISDLIENLVTMIRPQVDAHKHELIVNIHNVTHEKVIGDSLRVQQVFMNLVGNAVKYTPDNGIIRLSITEKPHYQKMVGCYEIVVEDNGIGMTEEYLTKIFEPFTRAEDSTVNKIQGTGLGMPIARNIVRMMGGDIQVESKPGEGSKFTVTFFLKLQPEEQIDMEEFANLPVLVVDDDRLSCESTCEILNDMGMKAEGVLSGEQAVECVKESCREGKEFFAVIMDWKMHGMNGLETTKAIREVAGDNIPVTIISAYDWSGIEQEAAEAGISSFVSKPLFKSRMIRLFNDLIGDAKEINEEEPLSEFEKMDFSGRHILLAEDNELNAEIAQEILGMTGVDVEWVSNGREAVEKAEESPDGYYSLIFMDIQMPVMNGYEATKKIRSMDRQYLKSLPIIAMTANAFSEDVHAAKQAGMDAHISKPLELETLQKILTEWVKDKNV